MSSILHEFRAMLCEMLISLAYRTAPRGYATSTTQAMLRITGMERERCVAEIRRVQRRNTHTAGGDAEIWSRAVKTVADECVDAITNEEETK